MSKRHLIVVDVEATGLDPKVHVPIEIAAINVDTDEVLSFVPHLAPEKWLVANLDALRINRYCERGVYKNALTPHATGEMYGALWEFLRGNSLAGANPRFDAAMLMAGYNAAMNPAGTRVSTEEPWHHRLPDVSSYVAGALGAYPSELPGLHECCQRLRVVNDEEHSALGDAKAAAECFRKAMAHMRGAW